MERLDGFDRHDGILGRLDEDAPPMPQEPPVLIRRDPPAAARGGRAAARPGRSAWFDDGPSRAWAPPPSRSPRP